MQENNFYVYAYVRFNDNTPYYIGKGKNSRAFQKQGHLHIPEDKSKIEFWQTNLSEEDAFLWEKYYIKCFGRKDNDTGILRNLTDGGEGTSGIKISEKTKELKIQNNIKRVNNGTHPFLDREAARQRALKRSEDKTHNFCNNVSQSIEQQKRVNNGTHPFLDREAARQRALKQIENGVHHSQIKNQCPHCGKIGKGNAMKKWHFNNCKQKK